MQLPTIHSNGTPRSILVEALAIAARALDEAYAAMKETAPNPRDYQGPEALGRAIMEHMSRLKRVDDVKNELDRMAVAIDDTVGTYGEPQ